MHIFAKVLISDFAEDYKQNGNKYDAQLIRY